FAWISMVLVDPGCRRQGLGTRILEGCLAETARRGLVPLLDATEAGEPLYRGLGFGPLFRLTRWIGQGGPGRRLRPVDHTDLALDVPVFG
ncbi:GNAT family N-acetyltransferase, partial [Vibrio parahaemolyticus]